MHGPMNMKIKSLKTQIEIRGRFLIIKCKVCNVALKGTLQVCLWKDWGKSQDVGLLGRRSSPEPPEYKLAILVTEQWSSMISVCSRLCVQIFCLKINSPWVRRHWGHQFYEFSSYSNIRRHWEGSEVQNSGMFKHSVGLLIQDYVIPRHVNKYCTRYILRIQSSKLSFCVLYCFNLIQSVRLICGSGSSVGIATGYGLDGPGI